MFSASFNVSKIDESGDYGEMVKAMLRVNYELGSAFAIDFFTKEHHDWVNLPSDEWLGEHRQEIEEVLDLWLSYYEVTIGSHKFIKEGRPDSFNLDDYSSDEESSISKLRAQEIQPIPGDTVGTEYKCEFVFGYRSGEYAGRPCGARDAKFIETGEYDGHDYRNHWLCERHTIQVNKELNSKDNQCTHIFGNKAKNAGERCPCIAKKNGKCAKH
jgi:hypothetical protein